MISLSTAIFLVLNIFDASFVSSQCILGKRDKDKEFPDLSKIISMGYTATVAASYRTFRQTILATEYYNITGKGRVDLLEAGRNKQYLYFNDTMETFKIEGFRCATAHADEFVIPFAAEMAIDWMYKENDRIVLGPSAMLWNARERYNVGKVNYMGIVKSESIRGITAEFWRGCLDNNRLIVDYYFSVAEWHSEYGTTLTNVPLRIEIQGETGVKETPEIDQVYEFVQFLPNILNEENVFAIPSGVDCKRLAKDLPVAPSFDGYDMYYGAEFMYTESGDDHIYVSDAYYAKDEMSGHVAYYYSTWGKVGKNGVRSANDYMSLIYNKQNGFLYNITTDKQTCKVTRDVDFDDGIPLPGSISLSLGSNAIIGDSTKMTYMGESKRRGIMSNAFEETQYLYGDETSDNFSSLVLTRYYVSKRGEYETGYHVEGTPLQALLRVTNTISKHTAELVINIFGFTTRLKEKNKLFNARSCSSESKNKMLHLIFEVPDENKILNMRAMVSSIKDQVLDLLTEHADLTPLRVPDILVDFDTSGIHVFANVLERPDFLLDFNFAGHYTLKAAEDISGLFTISQCAKRCLETAGICRGFSQCGSTCYLAKSVSSAEDIKESETCRFYKRVATENYPRDHILTTDAAIKQLASILFEERLEIGDSQSLFISVKWKDVKGDIQYENIPLTRVEAVLGDVNDMINQRLEDFDLHYDEYRYGTKLKKNAAHVKSHGAIPYQICQQLCLNNPECSSFSSCLGIPECLISTKHGDELEDSDFVINSRCLVVARKYVDAFVEYPGLMTINKAAKEINATNEEECAKACLNEKDLSCRSFDFCPRSKNKYDRCLLHSTHFLDIQDNTKETKVEGSELCGHYSRNYVRDFKKDNGKALIIDETSPYLELSGITIEQCAKTCVQNGAFPCNSFNYCKGSDTFTSYCQLSPNKEKEGKLINSLICSNYARGYYARNEEEIINPKTKKRFSTGTVAGLGFFFLLIGCGLGVVVMFAYAWYTGKRL